MRKPLALAAAVAVLAAIAAVSPSIAAQPGCPAGYRPAGSERSDTASRAGLPSSATDDIAARDANGALCVSINRPESFKDIQARDAQLHRMSLGPMTVDDAAGMFRASLDQRDAMVAAAAAAPVKVPGSTGAWKPYSKGPLISNDQRFDVSALGWVELNGRVDALDYDPKGKRLFALIGTGGVWMSRDLGKNWTSIGETLRTQINGSLAWSSAKGGTLVVVSGEALQAFGSRTGLGAFYTRDLGKTWKQAKGIPDGALGFKAAVDPNNPSTIYAATSRGLYRSVNAGETYTNVKLPTGDCAGKIDNKRCLLANMVTDVVVQSKDTFGNAGGRVLAVVGYRAGDRPFPSDPNVKESPWNGLYRSDSGKPGTFEVLPGTGFAPQRRIGRTEFGVAKGPNQNHNYVYALVQDAILFQGGFPTIDAPEDAWTGLNATVLNGVYVSPDFGSTWKLMADMPEISYSPTTGSGLIGTGSALLFAPGVQAWYNQFIAPDPTRQDANGVPTRLTFGLEEVWQNELTNQPQNGKSSFKVIGRYTAGESCQLLPTGVPACPVSRDPIAATTTHPDQQSVIWVPDGQGGVTLVVGNDGGVFTQAAAAGEELDNTKWGMGSNRGMNTLLPYNMRVAKDGRVWFGLQDNGSGYIDARSRIPYMTAGGDGFWVAVDPNNSDYAWSEATYASMISTTDGGKNWRNNAPTLTNAQFGNPFVMDPTDPNHLLTAGTEVVETLEGHNTCQQVEVPGVASQTTSCSWREVFNLGTKSKPGDAAAEASATDPANAMSAVDLYGANAYVGFCGPCDIMSTKVAYANGIATNVGAATPPEKGTTTGWHIAKARNLPARNITSITMDPKNPKTVYVTLGGYGRGWRGPGTFGDKNTRIGKGNVFVSYDAGESFRDISAGLPNAPGLSLALRGSQLLVGTDVGMFISTDRKGSRWAPMGAGLPAVPSVSIQVHPGDASRVIIATYGRGMYEYKFPAAAVRGARFLPPPAPRGPLAATGIGDPMTGVLLAAAAGVLSVRMRRRHSGTNA